MNVARDAGSSIYCPASAAEWDTALAAAGVSVSAPIGLWLMQESSGNVADSIGTITLETLGGASYNNAVAGWTRKGLGTADGSGLIYNNASGELPVPTTTSQMFIGYVAITATPGATRDVVSLGGSTSLRSAQVTTGPFYRAFRNSDVSGTDGSSDIGTGVRPLVIKIDRAASAHYVYSDIEKVTHTWAAPDSAAVALYIGGVDAGAPPMRILYGALFAGTGGEMTNAQIKTLLTTLGWTPTWTP
jgi:hypothetical protein